MISYVHKTDSIYTSYNRGGSRDSVDGGGSKMISYVHKTDSIYTSYNRGGSRDSVDGGGGGLKNDILCT